ncbi:MAG: hypothetical protein Q8L10_03655 [Candidatus Moranbacteria bacterium]|nr:hypothetical protein [Candidatus Moranbacteria bacterium]
MFNFEKEMIPILRKYLSEKYQISDGHFVSEFNSGNGIADLVFVTEKINNRDAMALDYDDVFTVLKYFNRKNKKIEIKKFCEDTFLTKKQVLNLINLLVKNEILEKINEDEFFVKNTYTSPIKEIISIEAKLADWKGGFYQALRYKTYSHESYLAISEKFSHRVDLDLLKKHNIGLIVVSTDKIDIILKAKKKNPSNLVAHAYLAEQMMRATYAR